MSQSRPKPWFDAPFHHLERGASVAVIGGGLAGASTAYFLAQEGVNVTLYERNRLASGASGNPQGMLYMKLSPHDEVQNELLLSGIEETRSLLKRLTTQGHLVEGEDWALSGLLQLSFNEREAKRHRGVATLERRDDARLVDREEASHLAGIHVEHGGLYFPKGGWVSPPKLVKALVDHPAITLCEETLVEKITYCDLKRVWHLSIAQEESPSFDGVVLAVADQTVSFSQAEGLPLRKSRGQITLLERERLQAPHCVVSGEGYIAPPKGGTLCFGATVKLRDHALDLRDEEHYENLSLLKKNSEALYRAVGGEALEKSDFDGRAALRSNAMGYLPVVGPLSKEIDFYHTYQALRSDARAYLTASCPYFPHLYINGAHGARGLITAPISGRVVAKMMVGAASPLPQKLQEALHPNRFYFHNLRFNKVDSSLFED